MPKDIFVLPVIRSLTFPLRHTALAPHSTAEHPASPSNAAEGCRGFAHTWISSARYSVRHWTRAGGAGVSSAVLKALGPSIGSVARDSAQVETQLFMGQSCGQHPMLQIARNKEGTCPSVWVFVLKLLLGVSLLWFTVRPFSLLHSLPPRRVFLLPQREHDGVSLPLPAVSQLPALSGLLLEGPCQRFPQQPAPNERVHVMGKGRLVPLCRLLHPPAEGEAPGHGSVQPSGVGRPGSRAAGSDQRLCQGVSSPGSHQDSAEVGMVFSGWGSGVPVAVRAGVGGSAGGWQQGARHRAASPIPTGLTVKSSWACSVWHAVGYV